MEKWLAPLIAQFSLILSLFTKKLLKSIHFLETEEVVIYRRRVCLCIKFGLNLLQIRNL